MRSPWLWRSLLILSAITFAGLVYLTRNKNFYNDEWDFVTSYRPSQWTSILLPHNEHWSTIPILVWKVLFILFGIRSHIPYEAVALAGHLACVLLLFELIRRRSGELPAFASALVLLVLGTGATNIVFAFQISWTLSIAFGLLAMLVVEGHRGGSRRRIAAVAGLLLCSLMSSGIGLGFLVAVTVELVVDRSRRRLLSAVPPVLGIYLLWFIVYGSHGAPCGGCPTATGALRSMDPGYLADVARFEWLGLTASVAGLLGMTLFGLPVLIAPALLVAFTALLAWHWYSQHGIAAWELGLLAGLLAQFTLVALVRARLGLVEASDPHYVYVGVVYMLPLAADALKRIAWRPRMRPLLAAAVGLVVLSNAATLIQEAPMPRAVIQTENAELRVVEMFRGAPGMSLDSKLDADVMPQLTAASYYAAVDELGSPVPASVPSNLDLLPANLVNRQLVALFGPSLTVTPDASRATATPCHTLDASSASTLDVRVPDGGSVMIQAGRGGDAAFFLGVLGPPLPRPVLETNLAAATREWVAVPDTGRPIVWQLRVWTAAVGQLIVCGVEHIQVHTRTSANSALAAAGSLEGRWVSSLDSGAYTGHAAQLPRGTATPSQNAFGGPMVLPAGTYDVWFRVRVTDTSGNWPEMALGVIDLTTQSYLGAKSFRADQVRTSYEWVRAISGTGQRPGDRLVFVAVNASGTQLSTDWFIDEALMLPAGASPPADVAPG